MLFMTEAQGLQTCSRVLPGSTVMVWSQTLENHHHQCPPTRAARHSQTMGRNSLCVLVASGKSKQGFALKMINWQMRSSRKMILREKGHAYILLPKNLKTEENKRCSESMFIRHGSESSQHSISKKLTTHLQFFSYTESEKFFWKAKFSFPIPLN